MAWGRAEARGLQILDALGVGAVPDFLAIQIEDDFGIGRRDDPVAAGQFALELAWSPARVAERDQTPARTLAVVDVAQQVAARRDGGAFVDVERSGAVIVGAVNDKTRLGLDRTAGKDA